MGYVRPCAIVVGAAILVEWRVALVHEFFRPASAEQNFFFFFAFFLSFL